MSRNKNALQNLNIQIGSKSFESEAVSYIYLRRRAGTNKLLSLIFYELTKLRKCYLSDRNPLFSRVLCEKLRLKYAKL
jgi:hypothetical protein